jgi:hypothetical protein
MEYGGNGNRLVLLGIRQERQRLMKLPLYLDIEWKELITIDKLAFKV